MGSVPAKLNPSEKLPASTILTGARNVIHCGSGGTIAVACGCSKSDQVKSFGLLCATP